MRQVGRGNQETYTDKTGKLRRGYSEIIKRNRERNATENRSNGARKKTKVRTEKEEVQENVEIRRKYQGA